jgi:NitT/TauT family transport system permease protein
VAITLAVIGAIVAEFIGGNQGLGYIIQVAGTYAETDLAFAGVAILSTMGISLYIMVIVLERLFVPWARATRAEGGVTI